MNTQNTVRNVVVAVDLLTVALNEEKTLITLETYRRIGPGLALGATINIARSRITLSLEQ